MKNLVRNLAAALIAIAGMSAQARDLNVGVSIAGQFQPGVYGQVNINTMPSYQLMYPQPMVMAQPAYAVPVAPVYMHVPVIQAQQWGSYCGYYNACSRPVYFVQPQYAPRHYHHGHHHGHGHGHGRGHGHHRGHH